MNDNHEVVAWGERPAVAAPPDLHARYETDAGTYATLRIYAFSVEGHPLVLGFGGTRLVRPEVAETKMTYIGVHTPFGPPLTGPFTSAPAGLMAVFSDGRECCSMTCTVAQWSWAPPMSHAIWCWPRPSRTWNGSRSGQH